ncbi:MAG: S1 RNA-binding domain-containing protein [archaeon]
MFFIKEGVPEEQELVLCTVTQIQFHSIFVKIDDYRNLSGMIHISEIAPGRIRNIRDYVKEGKVIVCKVLRVNEEKRQIDLSLRRVGEAQRRNKVNEMKHEQKAESVIEHISKELKIAPEKLYEKIKEPIFNKFSLLYECFDSVVEENLSLESLGIDKKTAELLESVIRQRFKPKEVLISGVFILTTYVGNGVEIIKNALIDGQKTEGAEITYLGGGKYKLVIKSKEYKIAEGKLEKVTEAVLSSMKKNNCVGEFIRGVTPKKTNQT